MVLVIKVAVAGIDLDDALATDKYILYLLTIGNLKMIASK